MITVHGSGRSHGRAVGSAGDVVVEGCQVGEAALLTSAAADRRHTIPGPDRCVVAGRPRRLRAMGPNLRPVPPVAAERDLAPDPHPSPDRADVKGAIVRDLSVDSTVCRAQQHAAGARKQGDLQKETERCVHRTRRSRAGTLARRVHHQAPPGHRAGSETFDRGDGRTTRGLTAVRAPRAPRGAGSAARPP